VPALSGIPLAAQPLLGGLIVVSDGALTGGSGSASPALAYNPAGGEFLVVWVQRDVEGTTDEVFGQRLDGAGERVGEPFRITHSVVMGGEAGAERPVLAWSDAAEEFLVVYESDRPGPDQIEIYGQRISAAGDLVGDPERITFGGDRSTHPSIAYNPASAEHLVAWQANAAPFVVDIDIHGQRFGHGPEGIGLSGPAIRISRMSDPATNRTAAFPDVAADPATGDFLVVWQSDGGGLPHLVTEIFGQRLGATGDEVGPDDFPISAMSASGLDRIAVEAAVAHDPSAGDWLVTWAGDGDGLQAEQFEIFAARVPAAGPVASAPVRISDAGSEGATAREPAPVVAGARAVVAWRASFGPGTFQVVASGLDPALPEPEPAVPLSGVGGAQAPDAAHRALRDEVLLVWEDVDILGQRWSTAGGVGTEPVPLPPPGAPALDPAFPNPFANRTTIPFRLERAGSVRLEVIDLLGRTVARLVDAQLPAGTHAAELDAAALLPGAYLVRLESGGVVRTRVVVRAR
jgi:hypothetical protein